MRKLRLIILVLFLVNLVFAEKIADLPEILEPALIYIQNNRIYIQEGKSIHIYSLSDLSHIKKFGREGEGPGEFKYSVDLSVYPGKLMVATIGKVVYFSPDGVLINELKIPSRIFMGLYQVGENFVCSIGVAKNNKALPQKAINIYDKNFKLLKNIYTGSLGQMIFFQGGASKKQDMLLIRDVVDYHVYKDKIYLFNTAKGFFFSVYNSAGELICEVNRKYKKLKVTEAYKKNIMKRKQEEPGWERNRKRFNFIFPDHFPAYHTVKFSKDKIYFFTYEKIDKKDEVIVTDPKGKFLRKTNLPFVLSDRFYSFSIEGDRAYFLVENEEEETWELHAGKLK